MLFAMLFNGAQLSARWIVVRMSEKVQRNRAAWSAPDVNLKRAGMLLTQEWVGLASLRQAGSGV
jgi:hypothetical protein